MRHGCVFTTFYLSSDVGTPLKRNTNASHQTKECWWWCGASVRTRPSINVFCFMMTDYRILSPVVLDDGAPNLRLEFLPGISARAKLLNHNLTARLSQPPNSAQFVFWLQTFTSLISRSLRSKVTNLAFVPTYISSLTLLFPP